MNWVKLTVGHDVWLDANTTITQGCTHIGNDPVLGSGSMVNLNVPPYYTVVGNPAKVVLYRNPQKGLT